MKAKTIYRPKIAFVSVYGIPCGISTYNEELIAELSRMADIKVFAEYADAAQSERLPNDPEWVVRCWDRNLHPKRLLIQKIREYDPDIVHISHEYGFFAKAYYFTSLVSTLKIYGYDVLGTLHSIYEHIDKTVTESCLPYIIAHSQSGKDCLIEKGIDPDKITMIPHGTNILNGDARSPKLLDELWNTWNSNHTIFQPGFLFYYKGHLKMLDIVAKLKTKYPDIQYIIQGSENPHTMEEHDKLCADILKKAEELNILDNITLNRGFADKSVLLSHIRTVKCCVLPYEMHPEHNVRGTSGIARLIAGTTTPLVTSNVHLFDDLEGVAEICATDEEMYNAIDNIFSNSDIKERQTETRLKFIKNTSWSKVALQVCSLYLKIANK